MRNKKRGAETTETPHQRFRIHLHLETECREKMTTEDVEKWTAEQFNGCDVGTVTVTLVEEE